MRPLRIIIVASLFLLPFVVLIGFGVWHLWKSGWWSVAWIPIAVCLGLAYFLAWRWQRSNKLLTIDFTPDIHWTERDRQAWTLVEARAKQADKLDPELFSDMEFYLKTAQDMAQELAQFYHPKAKDPIAKRTIPELLAVVELAAHDLADMVNKYMPAGHLLTVDNWKQAKKATEWYQTARNVGWIVSGLFSPINTGLRYMAFQAGVGQPMQKLHRHLIVWFYTAAIHRVGTYLIELNSGRLQIGADRYRQLKEKHLGDPVETDDANKETAHHTIIAVLGQSKTGKSSLINALLGEQRAKTDVIPATSEITRYELTRNDAATQLILLDTVGYGQLGDKADKWNVTKKAAEDADLILLVVHARNPGRQKDTEMLKVLSEYFERHPERNLPPVLAVLTHIDLLSPAMEWKPPYDWRDPKEPKEQNIHDAADAVREQFGDSIADVVPVCVAEGKVYAVQDELIAAISKRMSQAKAVALLRCLHDEADAGKVKRVFHQLLNAGKEAAKILGTLR